MGSWLSSLFSKKSSDTKVETTSTDMALLKIKVSRDNMHKEKKKIDLLENRLKEKAKDLLRNNEGDKAKLLLRRRKYMLNRMNQLETQLNNLITVIDQIEEKVAEKEYFDSLKQGTEELNKLQKEMSVEEIEALMQDSREAIDRQNEISEALSQLLTSEDEADVDSSLQELSDALLQESLDKIKTQKVAPSTDKVATKTVEEGESEESEEETLENRKAIAV